MSVNSGWGRLTWGQAQWNEDSALATGWGSKSWGDGEWGNLADETVTLTGLSITSTLNDSVTVTGTAVVDPTGISFTSTLGTPTAVVDVSLETANFLINSTQGYITTQVDVDVIPTGISFGSAVGVIDPADQIMGLTGLQITSWTQDPSSTFAQGL